MTTERWVSVMTGCKTNCGDCIALRCANALKHLIGPAAETINMGEHGWEWTKKVHILADWQDLIDERMEDNPDRLILNYLGDIGFCPEDFFINALVPYLSALDTQVVFVTKQPWRLRKMWEKLPTCLQINPHFTVAVSVENNSTMKRAGELNKFNVAHREVWMKPLREEITEHFDLLTGADNVVIAGLLSCDSTNRLHLPVVARIVEKIRAVGVNYTIEHGGGGRNMKYVVPAKYYTLPLSAEEYDYDELELMDKEILPGCTIEKREVYVDVIKWLMENKRARRIDIINYAASLNGYKTKGTREHAYLQRHGIIVQAGHGYWKLSL